MEKILSYLLTMLVTLIYGMFGCEYTEDKRGGTKVHTITTTIKYSIPQVSNKEKFINDLMLSPYWEVKKQKDGSLQARARSVSVNSKDSVGTIPPMLLFLYIAERNKKIPKEYIIKNNYMYGGKAYTSFRVKIIFKKPPSFLGDCYYHKGKPINLEIWESWEKKISDNSGSDLAFKLSKHEDIYVLLHEQGKDLNRKTTFKYVSKVLDEITRITKLPKQYYVKEVYKDFFNIQFNDLQKNCIVGRYPGTQSRDAFYGYFKTNKNIDYNGINLKVSHPVYCEDNGECTVARSRIRKAESLGKPYFSGDLLYFQIDDNAVLLSSEKYNKMFGVFSGKKSFKAKLEVLNEKGKVLYENFYQFRGWER